MSPAPPPDKMLDHVYTKMADAYKAVPLPHLGQFDHLSVAPFTLPFACRHPVSILHILLCVKASDAARDEISLRHWSASGGSVRAVLLANQTSVNGSQWRRARLHDKSNVVTVTVFGNLYEEKNTTAVGGEASVLPPNYQIFLTFLLKKQCLSPAKNFMKTWWKQITVTVNPPDQDLSEPSRRKQPLYWSWLCNYVM